MGGPTNAFKRNESLKEASLRQKEKSEKILSITICKLKGVPDVDKMKERKFCM